MAPERPTAHRAATTAEADVLELLHSLHGASQVYRARADENAAVGGVNFARTQVLGQLREGPQSVPAVARRLSLTRQSVQSVMDRLLEAGLVERTPNPGHRSSSLFRITAQGSAVMDGVRGRAARMYAAIAAEFTASEIEDLTAMLQRLRDLGLATPRVGDDTDEAPADLDETLTRGR
ncbi:MarR family transcriptional regulator [Actinomadura madurae]|uniref:DNA-binding transcriptional regulator, MarR family n=2 Tax=Actinomadura madurae TaxID=1993 RepID=A0A1I5PRM9_9ACTN|nr:helix-turn-helix domain-containing protein [Actinomadura madurae]SFP36629.1 DNA-binding transcriptional regulator, MarR family [Actinomadura madurae]SPT64022.1 DNA-binding transcriptional repressor MarR [Actinomadura madurae]